MVDFKFIPGFSEKGPSSELEGGIFNRLQRVGLGQDRVAVTILKSFPDLDVVSFSTESNATSTSEKPANYNMPVAKLKPEFSEQKQHVANGALQGTLYQEELDARHLAKIRAQVDLETRGGVL